MGGLTSILLGLGGSAGFSFICGLGPIGGFWSRGGGIGCFTPTVTSLSTWSTGEVDLAGLTTSS